MSIEKGLRKIFPSISTLAVDHVRREISFTISQRDVRDEQCLVKSDRKLEDLIGVRNRAIVLLDKQDRYGQLMRYTCPQPAFRF